jgi:hypothetical protein
VRLGSGVSREREGQPATGQLTPAKVCRQALALVLVCPRHARVGLVRRNLERHGDGWEAMRDAVGSEDGWPEGLRSFAADLAESG